MAIVLLACTKKVSPGQWPDGYSLVTVQSGRTYKVLQIGPMTGQGGKHLAGSPWCRLPR
jgi:hypothetical protein